MHDSRKVVENVKIKFHKSRAAKNEAAHAVVMKIRDLASEKTTTHTRTFKTETEAEDFAATIRVEQKSGSVVDRTNNNTFGEAAKRYKQHLQQRFDEGKIVYAYRSELQKCADLACETMWNNKPFAKAKLPDITLGVLEDVVMTQMKNRPNKRGGIGLGHKSMKARRTALQGVFKQAIRDGILRENPALGIEIHKVRYNRLGVEVERDTKLQTFKLDDMSKLIDASYEIFGKKWCDAEALSFACQTGLSFQEQAAITWKQIDFDHSRLIVRDVVRQVQKNCFQIEDVAKSDCRHRRVPLSPSLITELKEWRLRSPYSQPNDLVFPQQCGNHYRTSDHWRRFSLNHSLIKAKLGYSLSWHELRHFFATMCVAVFSKDLKADWTYITEVMGHTSEKVTREHYVHWLDDPERDRDAGERLGQFRIEKVS